MSTGTKTSLTPTSELLIPAMSTERVCATARRGSKLGLVINNADNELIPSLNTEQVYDRKTGGNPTFNDSLDLSGKLKHGHNSFVILGWPCALCRSTDLGSQSLAINDFWPAEYAEWRGGLVGRGNNRILTLTVRPFYGGSFRSSDSITLSRKAQSGAIAF
jgi:hypothetical protein